MTLALKVCYRFYCLKMLFFCLLINKKYLGHRNHDIGYINSGFTAYTTSKESIEKENQISYPQNDNIEASPLKLVTFIGLLNCV